MTLGFNWFLLAITIGVMFALGYYASKIASKKGESGFLLAAKSLGPFVGAATIAATGFSGWGFMGSPGVAYKYGAIELLGNFFFAPAMVLATVLCAKFFNKRAAEMGSLTIPEFIVKNHDGPLYLKRLTQGLCAVITILLLLVFMVGQIKALGLLAGQWLGISRNTAALIMIIIIIGYTVAGGLAAVAWTDTVMVIGMCVSAVIITARIFTDVSLESLLAQVDAIDPVLLNPPDSTPYGDAKFKVFFILPYAFLYATTTPHMAVRLMAFKPETKTHHVIAFMTPIVILLSLVPLAGIYTRIMIPDLADPDQAMPIFLSTFLSPPVAAVITLFILFAMKSTTNSVLHSLASAVSHDLRQAISPETKDSAALLAVNRLTVASLGILGYLTMIYAPPFMLSWLAILGAGTLMATLVAPMLVCYFIKGDIYAALAAVIVGFCSSSYLFFGQDLGWISAPLIACILSSVTYVLVAKLKLSKTSK